MTVVCELFEYYQWVTMVNQISCDKNLINSMLGFFPIMPSQIDFARLTSLGHKYPLLLHCNNCSVFLFWLTGYKFSTLLPKIILVVSVNTINVKCGVGPLLCPSEGPRQGYLGWGFWAWTFFTLSWMEEEEERARAILNFHIYKTNEDIIPQFCVFP